MGSGPSFNMQFEERQINETVFVSFFSLASSSSSSWLSCARILNEIWLRFTQWLLTKWDLLVNWMRMQRKSSNRGRNSRKLWWEHRIFIFIYVLLTIDVAWFCQFFPISFSFSLAANFYGLRLMHSYVRDYHCPRCVESSENSAKVRCRRAYRHIYLFIAA